VKSHFFHHHLLCVVVEQKKTRETNKKELADEKAPTERLRRVANGVSIERTDAKDV